MSVRGLMVLLLAGMAASGAPRQAGAQAPSGAAASWAIYFRYGSTSPEYAFAAISRGRPSLMAGVVADAPNGYEETLAGAGMNLYSAAGHGASVYALASRATDAWYGVLYVLPTATFGRVNVSAFGGAYQPLEEGGTRQGFLDPVTALVALGPALAIGGSYSLYAGEGWAARASAGPVVRVAVPKGTVALDALRSLAGASTDVRVTLQLAF